MWLFILQGLLQHHCSVTHAHTHTLMASFLSVFNKNKTVSFIATIFPRHQSDSTELRQKVERGLFPDSLRCVYKLVERPNRFLGGGSSACYGTEQIKLWHIPPACWTPQRHIPHSCNWVFTWYPLQKGSTADLRHASRMEVMDDLKHFNCVLHKLHSVSDLKYIFFAMTVKWQSALRASEWSAFCRRTKVSYLCVSLHCGSVTPLRRSTCCDRSHWGPDTEFLSYRGSTCFSACFLVTFANPALDRWCLTQLCWRSIKLLHSVDAKSKSPFCRKSLKLSGGKAFKTTTALLLACWQQMNDSFWLVWVNIIIIVFSLNTHKLNQNMCTL